MPFCRRQHDVVVARDDPHVDQLVSFVQLDGNNAPFHRPAVGREGRFLHRAVLGRHDQELLVGEFADRQATGHALFGVLQREQIDDRPPAAGAALQRQIVDLLPMHAAPIGEEQQIGVRAGDEEMLDVVLFVRLDPRDPFAAAVLRLVGAERRRASHSRAARG